MLISSSAHQLISSSAHQRTQRANVPHRAHRGAFVGLVMTVLLFLLATGCDTAAPSTSSLAVASSESLAATSGQVGSLDRFELGVIDYQRGGYVCLPLDRLGIADATQIVELETSCDCTTVQMVEYLQLDGSYASALRIDIEGEAGSIDEDSIDPAEPIRLSDDAVRPFSLAVKVTVHLANNHSQELTVAFVQSPIRWEAER